MRQCALAVLLIAFTQLSLGAPCDAPAKLVDGWDVQTSATSAGFDQARLWVLSRKGHETEQVGARCDD
jgi:hypothetical protein